MHVAERLIRNRSRIRRMLLLRKLQYKFRSLSRARFCSKIINTRIGNDFALETTIKEIIRFLKCSFAEQQKVEVITSLNDLEKSLLLFSHMVQAYRSKQKPIPINIIAICTRSMRRLYYATKGSQINLDCNEIWYAIGLNLIVLFDIDNIINA